MRKLFDYRRLQTFCLFGAAVFAGLTATGLQSQEISSTGGAFIQFGSPRSQQAAPNLPAAQPAPTPIAPGLADLPGGMGNPSLQGPDAVGTNGASPGMMMGGMGGMGGPGMSGNMMGSMGMSYPSPPAPPLVVWEKPQGEKPQWLVTGNKALEATESCKISLETMNECDFPEQPLQEALRALLEEKKISYWMNEVALDEAGESQESIVALKGKGPTRELLRRLLSPLQLTYVVREGFIEITNEDAVLANPPVRTYDLAHVMSNNQGISELLSCIQLNIAPGDWEGGDASLDTFGSLLVVRAREEIHSEIGKLLASVALSPVASNPSPASAKQHASPLQQPFPPKQPSLTPRTSGGIF